MRRLILMLLMLLLPMRVLGADAMAFGMLADGAASSAAAIVAAAQAAPMPPDCPMSATAGIPPGTGEGGAGGCQSCQLCTSLAASPVSPLTALSEGAAALPGAASEGFRSAEVYRELRPPIS